MTLRVEACACGSHIAATNLDECAPAVERHNRTSQHRTWRVLGGFTPHNPTHDTFLIGLRKSREMQPQPPFFPLRTQVARRLFVARSRR